MTLKKILELLNSSEKKTAFLLLILTLFMAFLDMLGVASIMPFVAVLANPEIIENNDILNYLFIKSSNLGVENNNDFLFLLGISVFILLIVSITTRLITNYLQISFALMREYSIGKKLVEGYLSQPYEWFINKNSSELGKGVLSEVGLVINGVLKPTIQLITQSAVTFAILLLLIFTDPKLAISIGFVLGFCYIVIYLFIKNTLSRIGNERIKANTERFRATSEAFAASKEVKLAGLEKFYLNLFSKPARTFASNQSLSQIITQLPRYFIEGIAFGGMIILVLILISRDGELSEILPLIALYALAGYRLIPALQQIYAAKTTLRFNRPSLDKLYNDLISLKLDFEELSLEDRITLNKSINLNNVNFKYQNSKSDSLKNINISIPVFKKIGIVGSTGGGKTTMVDLILGLLDARKGSLSVDGVTITNSNKHLWQKKIGYVPQQIYLSDSTIKENIAFGVEPAKINQQILEKSAKIAQIYDFIHDELPLGYNTIIGERGIKLSGGQRQRIGIARAMYRNPELLIFDEATSALDNITEREVMNAVNSISKNITIILIAHRLSTVKTCDNIFFLDNGELKAQGTYDELNETNQEFKKLSKLVQ